METIVIASDNANKIREIKSIFPEYNFVSKREAGYSEEVEENGADFKENALIKARAAMRKLNRIALADDSGLCVEALGGAPGIYSARYSGVPGDDGANRRLLLKNLENEENRRAYFACAVALVYPDGREYVCEGRTYGRILTEETGDNGFGYDCLFYSDELNKSFGIAEPSEKNAVSHRYRALAALKDRLSCIR